MKIIVNCYNGNIKPKDAEPTKASEDYGCDACEYIHNNQIHRCSNFIFITGKDPQNNKQYIDVGKCAETWGPTLTVENSLANRSMAAAMESMRNETAKRQDTMISLIGSGVAIRHDQITTSIDDGEWPKLIEEEND